MFFWHKRMIFMIKNNDIYDTKDGANYEIK